MFPEDDLPSTQLAAPGYPLRLGDFVAFRWNLGRTTWGDFRVTREGLLINMEIRDGPSYMYGPQTIIQVVLQKDNKNFFSPWNGRPWNLELLAETVWVPANQTVKLQGPPQGWYSGSFDQLLATSSIFPSEYPYRTYRVGSGVRIVAGQISSTPICIRTPERALRDLRSSRSNRGS